MIESKGLSPELLQRLPMSTDGVELWNLYVQFFHDYVYEVYVDEAAVAADGELALFWRTIDSCGGKAKTGSYGLPALTRTSLVDYCAHVAFTVTAQHELVGEVVQYCDSIDAGTIGIRPGTETQDVQGYMISMILIALTGLRNPSVMDDWRHLLPAEPAALRGTHYKSLMAGMEALGQQIHERNKSRVQPCNSFNPLFHECSVSV
jgi:hypothetical protein